MTRTGRFGTWDRRRPSPVARRASLGWSIAVASGADAGIVTPIAWAIGLVALIGFATRRTEVQEL